jgi:hypothetical protein
VIAIPHRRNYVLTMRAAAALSLLLLLAVPAFAQWANACGDGRVDRIVDSFDDLSVWSYCCSDRDLSPASLSPVAGCSGQALRISYNLGGEWLVVLRAMPAQDLSSYSHIRLALRGTSAAAHHDLQVKLGDAGGRVNWVLLRSVADLPVWRVVYIDLRELECFDTAAACAVRPPLDLTKITRLELAVSRCRDGAGNECEPGAPLNAVDVDELAAVDLKPGSPRRIVESDFERVTPSPDLRSSIANALLRIVDDNGLVPAWIGESPPNYNTYTEALAILVFTEEWNRTADVRFRDAARRVAEKMIALQNGDGSWMTAYTRNQSGAAVPFDASCRLGADLDRCFWVGNEGWMLIALAELRTSGAYANAPQLADAIARGAAWLAGLQGSVAYDAALVTQGLEGNVSAYFGLRAALRTAEAARLADAIQRLGWDPVERRMKISTRPVDLGTAMDMAGSWGVQFLRAVGRRADALASQGFAATVLRTTSFSAPFIDLYGDIAGPWTPTIEFSSQGAAAGIAGADAVMKRIYPLQASDGLFPGSTDDFFGGAVASWSTPMRGVAPTAWVYFAQNGDPLARFIGPPRPRAVRPPS